MAQGWKAHEADVQGLLGLSPTICSGNKFHDPGDAVDHSHPSQNSFALIADCKCTSKKSFSVKMDVLVEWQIKAAEMGKRFIMPIRFDEDASHGRQDYVLLSLDDFAELMEMVR